MKKITVLATALLLCGPMMAQTNSTYDAQFIDWPTYSGDDLELNVDSKGTAFRMTDAKEIARNLKFDKIDSKKQPNLISYSLLNNANGDEWKEIKVIFNGADHAQVVKLPKGKWQVVARDGKICLDNTLGTVTSPEVQVSPRSALIMHR